MVALLSWRCSLLSDPPLPPELEEGMYKVGISITFVHRVGINGKGICGIVCIIYIYVHDILLQLERDTSPL